MNDKSDLNLYYKELIENIICSNLWKEYLDFFREEINELFGDRYRVKIIFGHFYREVIDEKIWIK